MIIEFFYDNHFLSSSSLLFISSSLLFINLLLLQAFVSLSQAFKLVLITSAILSLEGDSASLSADSSSLLGDLSEGLLKIQFLNLLIPEKMLPKNSSFFFSPIILSPSILSIVLSSFSSSITCFFSFFLFPYDPKLLLSG